MINTYVLHDSDGSILSVSVQKVYPRRALEAGQGILAMSGRVPVDPNTQAVIDGALVDRPSQQHAWSGTAWELDSAKQSAALGRAKHDAKKGLGAAYDYRAEAIAGDYPLFERAAWEAKKQAATQIKSQGASSLPPESLALLQPEATARSVTLDALADMIIAKSSAFHAVTGALMAARITAEQGIDAAQDIDAVDAAVQAYTTQLDNIANQ